MSRAAALATVSLVSLVALLASACPPPPLLDGGPDPSFEDHTKGRFTTTSELLSFASEGAGSSALKLVITRFGSPPDRELRYMDGAFYTLHDEWFWFRLMNGERVDGVDMDPYDGQFATVQEIVAWAEEQDELPLDLRFVGERLYSPRFYELALTDPRGLGVATLVHFPARTEPEARDEIWAFELEYQDDIEHAELVGFFVLIDDTAPDGVSGEVKWLVRSPAQEALALAMEEQELAYHDRILRYDDVVVPGEVQVYSEGIVAGRMKLVGAGEPGLEGSRSTDLLALGFVPDFLPPCTGLLTAVPQTPLAHINVLARNRGIPNAYVGGLLGDANVDQLGRVRAPAILLAEKDPDRVVIKAIDESDFATWRSLSQPPQLAVPPVDIDALPYSYDLATLSFDDVALLRPIIGGKSAGFLGLMAPGDVVMPDLPLAITVRAYAEHVAPLMPRLQAMLASNDFGREARMRFLVLEGEEAFALRYTTPDDERFLVEFFARPTSDPLRALVAEGGVRAIIKGTPMAAGALAAIEGALASQFASFDTDQGLRFRSSSNVEDIEGFNGAGLYESYSGWLFPDVAGRPGRDVETAIKSVWASYWGSEAYEERTLARVTHLSGHMAVTVHARFDDEAEVSNAVFTYTLLPDELDDEGVLEVNAQVGALSVTNPPPGTDALPEVDVVRLPRGASEPSIARVQASTELPAGGAVLDDDKLLELFFSAKRVAERWIVVDNQGLLASQRRRTLVLDFELREMASGWPDLAGGAPFPQRLIIKQARTLEPGTLHIPDDVRGLPFPRDVLARARLVERRACAGDKLDVTVAEAFTDPLVVPDLGYSDVPFTAFVTLDVKETLPAVGLDAGRRVSFVHTGFASVAHPGLDEGSWGLAITIDPARPEAATLSAIAILPDGTWELERGADSEAGAWLSCEKVPLFSTPEQFLRGLLEE